MTTDPAHPCMNLFEQEVSNLSLAKKRHEAMGNHDYRAKALFG